MRKLKAQTERVETGVVQFGEDWPGVFIRGDTAFLYGGALKKQLQGATLNLSTLALWELLQLLEGSKVQDDKEGV